MPSKAVPISIEHSFAGLDRSQGYQSQPPYSSVDQLNVRGRDTLARRQRGGSRPFLSKAFPTRLGAIVGASSASLEWQPSKDTYLHSGSPNSNFDAVSLLIGYTGAAKFRTILHFDLTTSTPIPHSTTVITAASLRIYISSLIGGTITGTCRRVRRTDWVETQASWNNYKTASAWTTAGCDSGVSDYDATSQATFTISSTGFLSITGLAALVQDAYNSRSDQLHLELISNDEATAHYAAFNDSESSNDRPTLLVDFTTGTGTSFASGPIRLLSTCDSLNTDGNAVYADEYSDPTMADYSTGSFTLDSVASSAKPAVASGYATTNLSATAADLRSAILTTRGASTAAYREVQLGLDYSPTGNGLPAPSYAYVFMDLNNASPTPVTGGIYVKATNFSVGGFEVILYMNGSEVARTTRSPGPAYLNPTLRVSIDSTETVRVYFSDANVPDIAFTLVAYTPAGDRVGFGLRENVGGINGGDVRSNFFRFQYVSSSGGDPRNMLMASANGILYKQTLLADWATVTSTITLAKDRLLRATSRLQKMYIADYGVLVSAGDGVTSASAAPPTASTFTSALHPDWTAVTGLTAGDYVRITNGTGVVLGDYRIQEVAPGSDVTKLSILGGDAPGNATGLTYKILRGPKVYDAETNQLTAFTPLTSLVPAGNTIVETWLDALVWGGDPDYPHRAFKSKSGDPTDYTYGSGDPLSAVAYSASEETAELGDRIRAIGSPRDDYLIFGGERDSFLQRGDPVRSGGISEIAKLGVLDKHAWCQTPDGLWIAMTSDGLYKLIPAPSARPEPMSKKRMPLELRGISPDLYDVQVGYDQDYDGVDVIVSPKTVGDTKHWFFDLDTEAFEPMQFFSDHDPTAIAEHSLPGETPTVFFGCRDGYVRRFDDAALTDDGSAVTSRATYGPIKLGRAGSTIGRVAEVILQLANGSAAVDVYIMTGNSPEDAWLATPRLLGSVTANGKPKTFAPFATGAACYIRLVSTGRWARELLNISVQSLGKLKTG